MRTDLRRISDLSTLQNEIVDYYRAKNALPQSLDQLTNSISGFRSPNDPQSQRPYEYRVTGTLSFQLCGRFQPADGAGEAARLFATGPLRRLELVARYRQGMLHANYRPGLL